METSPRKYLYVIGCFLLFNKNVAGPNVTRFIERSMEHMSTHVYTEKDEVLQKKEKAETNICLNFNNNKGQKINCYSTFNR